MVDPNPNVYYQLGIAEAFLRPVIRIAADPADLPFDVRDMRVSLLPSNDNGMIDVAEAGDCVKSIRAQLPMLLADEFVPSCRGRSEATGGPIQPDP